MKKILLCVVPLALACTPRDVFEPEPNQPNLPRREAVWGIADLHAHPAAHMAYSSGDDGNDGIFFGHPGSALANAQADLDEDLKPCATDIHGMALNVITHATRETVISALAQATGHPHGKTGYPDFKSWPHASSWNHQQMHITAIRRAYDAGLRLMFASITDNQTLTKLWNNGDNVFGSSPATDGTFEQSSGIKQVKFIKQMVSDNSSWMQIVQSATDARGAIHENKLALVLSLEMDQMNADQVIAFQVIHGVRHVIPIHIINNAFGGAAVYNDVFNTSNRYLGGQFFHVEGSPTTFFRLSPPIEIGGTGFLNGLVSFIRGVSPAGNISRQQYCDLGYEPCPDVSQVSSVPFDEGHRNTQGLNSTEIQKLMKAGMIIDLAHMSEKSMADVLQLASQFNYPLMNSHTSLRDTKPLDAVAGPKPKRRVTSERDMTLLHTTALANGGGVLGLGTEGRLDPLILTMPTNGTAHAFGAGDSEFRLPLTVDGQIPLSAIITELEITITTGSDDLHGNGEDLFGTVWVGATAIDVGLNLGMAWPNNHVTSPPISVPLPPNTTVNDLTKLDLNITSTSDNWNMDKLEVVAIGPAGHRTVMLEEGFPFHRFKGDDQHWTENFDFTLPPDPDTRVKSLRVTMTSGEDDLRGGNDNATLVYHDYRTASDRPFQLNDQKSIGSNQSYAKTIPLPPGQTLRDLETISIETGFGGSVGGDNWDLADLTIEYQDSNGVFHPWIHRHGEPWFRFTGDLHNAPAYTAPPETDDPTLDAAFLKLIVTNGLHGTGEDTLTGANIVLANNSIRQLDLNLGGKLEDKGKYVRVFPLPAGTKRADLVALIITKDPNAGDDWDIEHVEVDILGDPLAAWLGDYNEAVQQMGNRSVALGTDFNGFATQIPFFRAEFDYPLHAPNNHAPPALKTTVPLIERSTLGNKVFDVARDGFAHYGMLGEFVESLDQLPGGSAAVDKLYGSAEAVLVMWEQVEQAKANVP